MNVYAVVIPIALVVEYSLHLAADLLNLRALAPELPDEFRDVYDSERYRRSQEYTRVNTRFGMIPTTFDLAVLLAFWYGGGFQWLDKLVRGLGYGPILTGLVYMGLLVGAKLVLGLPFSWYGTFVIEERFGFNKTTLKTFWLDVLKSIALAVVLGGPLLAGILWFFEAAGSVAWIWCWALVSAFALLIQFIAPTWIMPLFNKFTPLEEGELREAVMGYAQKVGFPLDGLFVIDGSRRSTKANAFFTGFGKHKRIALFDTLTEKQSTGELVAIVAHEIGHYKRGHIRKRLIIGIVQSGLVFFLLSLFLTERGLFDAFYMDEMSNYTGLIFFGMLFSPIDLVLSFFVQAFSRQNEFEADAYARETTGTGERLVASLKQLAAESLQNLTPHPFYVKLHYSHPPLMNRIEALRS